MRERLQMLYGSELGERTHAELVGLLAEFRPRLPRLVLGSDQRRQVLLATLFLLLLTGVPSGTMAQSARPPAPDGQDACLVWWQAPEHAGEVVTFCGSPETATEQDGYVVLQLGPTSQDLLVGLPLELRGDCGETLDRVAQNPAAFRIRATGELRSTGDGPFLVVSSCDQFSVEWQTF